mgnify:CR=1 FL=1
MYNIPQEAVTALEVLERNGFEAYLVGGCVRDFLLGRIPNDYDITTNALPDRIIEIFSDYHTIPTGIKHGTVTVIIKKFQIEITTYRKDSTYSDNRHPDSVEFTPSLKEDLARRDFSMNGMAMNFNQDITDIYNGREDMKNHIVKCIENPDRRFDEDALRILRALRFASQLDFKIEKNTSDSIHKNAENLKNISAERINAELEKLIAGKNPYYILKKYEDVIKVFMPEYSYSESIMKKNISSQLIRRSAFFLNIKSVYDIMKRLKYSNKDINDTVKLIEYFNADISSKPALKIILKNIGTELTENLLDFRNACGQDTSHSEKLLDEILKNNECYLISQLDINGRDLMLMGFSGIQTGKILNTLLEKVINDEIENNKTALKEYTDAFLQN